MLKSAFSDQKPDMQNLVDKGNALHVYEQRLQAARTWPYNISMLRTLFFSELTPLRTWVGRLLIDLSFPEKTQSSVPNFPNCSHLRLTET
jgi:hypothetical protein